MRKAAVMIGFGAFFVTMALLMRFYAYPKLAVIPKDQNTQQTVTDDHAKFFDADTVKEAEGKIITKATVVADQDASKKASDELERDVVVINMWQSTDNPDAQGVTKAPPIDASTTRVAVDRSTGEAVKWSGNTINGKQVDISGQTIKFPFRVDKNKSYNYWDGTVLKAVPMKYSGEETIDGMKTYRFSQTIPRTKIGTRDVPGEIFGKPKGGVVADRYYENTRTVWVDPETGVMMKLQEKQHQTLEIPNASPVNAMTTTSTMTDDTIKKNVDEYKTKGQQLRILHFWAPLLLTLLGLFAIGLGIFVSLRSGRRGGRHGDTARDESYDHDDTIVEDGRRSRGASQVGHDEASY